MEEKNTRPSRLQNKNLAILVISRTAHFTNKGLYPYLLSTYFFYIDEGSRLPLARTILPLIFDKTHRGILELAIKNQGEQWEPLEPFKSSWTYFRKAGIVSTATQQFEDLLQLDYYRLLDGVSIPRNAKLTLFWGGLVDFLANSWSILEEFCLVIQTKEKMRRDEELRQKAGQQTANETSSGPRFVRLVTWADMQLEHHLINVLLRLRAGWDKLADYVLAPYYNVPPAKKWKARVNKLDREIQSKLSERQRPFWTNWLSNARNVSNEMGLKDVRDLELHKIGLRVRETLGHPQRAPALSELENFILFEHFRLQESFLLVLAMIRSA